MKKKKILYIVSDVTTAGGVMSITSKKVNYLVQKGYKVDIMSIRNPESIFYPLDDKVNILSFCKHRSNLIGNLFNSIRTIRKRKYDIVISADAQYLTWVLPFFVKARIFLELHQSYDGIREYLKNKYRYKIIRSLFSILKKISYPFYDRIVTLTEEDKEKWGYKKTVVVPNFHNLPLKENNEEYKKSVVCVGRFHHQKGYHLLIDVWKIVSKKYPDWRLDYYGEELSEKSMSILKTLNAPSSFVLKGYENDPDKLYGGYYLNIVPSISESFSLSIIEAMCYAVPSVSFDITGPHALIFNDKNGVLIEPYRIKDMAEKIITLLENHTLRDRMSRECIYTARLYKQEEIMKKWIKLFDNI